MTQGSSRSSPASPEPLLERGPRHRAECLVEALVGDVLGPEIQEPGVVTDEGAEPTLLSSDAGRRSAEGWADEGAIDEQVEDGFVDRAGT